MTTTNNPHQIDYNNLHPSMWLPTTVKEMKALGWDYVDIVIFSGDAYIDHPSFGAAVIGRTLQAAGYRRQIRQKESSRRIHTQHPIRQRIHHNR